MIGKTRRGSVTRRRSCLFVAHRGEDRARRQRSVSNEASAASVSQTQSMTDNHAENPQLSSVGSVAAVSTVSGISSALRELWLDLLALLWPCACLVCGAADRELCTSCAATLRSHAGHAAIFLAPAGFEVWGFSAYEGALRTLIIACKNEGRPQIVRVLGELLSGPLQAALQTRDRATPLLVLTVPSRPAKIRERGFRHVDLLVRRALKRLRAYGDPGAQLLTGALHTLPGRTGQVGLRAAQRERNAALVRVPWHMRGRLRGRDVVLVDDIVTTGSTILASTRALAAVDARVIGIVVLGVTKRKDLGPPQT